MKVKTSTELNPGVLCDGITVNSGATLTLNPRIYYFDRGTFSVNGDGTVTGTGVTLIFTSSTGTNWATATINGNASVNLTAPNSGSAEGIVLFMDPHAPTGTSLNLSGSSTQTFGGAIYAPRHHLHRWGANYRRHRYFHTGNSSVAINSARVCIARLLGIDRPFFSEPATSPRLNSSASEARKHFR